MRVILFSGIRRWELSAMEMKQRVRGDASQILRSDRFSNDHTRNTYEVFTHPLEDTLHAALQLKKRSGRYEGQSAIPTPTQK